LPLLGIELWFDMRSRSRRLLPELAGSIGIAAIGAAIVLAGGGPAALAVGVWTVVAARAVASLPFVRHQLARAKHRPTTIASVATPPLAAAPLADVGWRAGWRPLAAVAAIAVLAVIQLALCRTRPPRAAILGVQQLAFGLAVVLVTAATI